MTEVEPLLPRANGSQKTHGMRVTFSSLEYKLPSNVKRGEIAVVLKTMSGYFNPGEMTAVMGPSGCGKSMLMDTLAGRHTSGTVNGEIRYDSRTPSAAFLKRSTVFEMLMYTAELKVQSPIYTFHPRQRQAVEELIEKLALTSCRDVKIGNPHLDRGISGGEGKRVNIGIALITNPRVLYMDEPVSGLDSCTANEVMEVIQRLVHDGTTLCATLHSPTPYTFCLFDRILLLVQGTMVFFGERKEVVGYFESLLVGSSHQSQSVAEWLTEIIVKADQENTTPTLITGYQRSYLRQRTEEALLTERQNDDNSDDDSGEADETKAVSAPFWFSLRILLAYRSVKNLTSLSFWLTRTIDKTVIVILLSTMYRGLGDDFSPLNYTNLSALMFIWSTFSASGAVVYVPRIIIDRWVFYREQRDGLYSVLAYFLIKVIEEYLVAAVLTVVYSTILWYAIDLQGNALRFALTFYGMFASSIVLALFFGAIAPNVDMGNALFPCYMMTLLFYAGYLLLPPDIPDYLVWYSKADFLRYSYGALMVNQFTSKPHLEGLAVFFGPEDYLDRMGLSNIDPDWYISILFIFAGGYGLIAFLAMRFVRHERKR